MGMFVAVLETDISEPLKFDGVRVLAVISSSDRSKLDGKLVLAGISISSEPSKLG